MKEIIKSEKIFIYLLLICSFGIGLHTDIYKYAIIALLLQWLLSADYRRKFVKLKQNNFAAGLIGLYCLYAISFFWSDNKEVMVIDILLKSPLLILPLVILSQKSLSVKETNQMFLSFALSSVLLNLFCFGDAYFSFLKTNSINEFLYADLTIHMNPSFQSMFTCFSIVIFVYLFIKEKFISNWITYSSVAIQMIFVLLLASRMQILIMIVIVPVYLIFYHYKRKKAAFGLLYTLLIFGFSYLIISAPSVLNSRYAKTVSQINSIGVNNDNFDPRKVIWAEGLEVIKNHWLIGAGAGDAKDALVGRYSKLILDNPTADNLVDSTVFQILKDKKTVSYLKEKAINSNNTYEEQLSDHAKDILERRNSHYREALQRQYNFHNQYLQTFGEIGVFGFLLLFFLLSYPFIVSIRNKDYIFTSFLFIVGASFLTESTLEREAGVAFIVFFYVLLSNRLNQNKLF